MGRIREGLPTFGVLVFVLGVEAYGLRKGGTGLLLLAFLGFVAIVVFTLRLEIQRIGLAAAIVAAGTLTWNGWFVGPLRPGDALIPIALGCFLIADANGAFSTPPWWVKQLVFVLVIGVLAQVLFPPELSYLASRTTYTAGGKATLSVTSSLNLINITVAIKFAIAVAAIPMAFVGATRVDKRALRWLVMAFVVGAGMSGLAAGVDHLGFNVASIITRVPNVSPRQAGFATHPNFLAVGLVIAIPFAFWLLFTNIRRDRLIGAISMIGLLVGVYASGSRGGAVGAVIAVGLCIVAHPRTRVYSANIGGAVVVLVGVVAAALPEFGQSILRVTRLAGNVTSDGSDQVRALAGAQGSRDFHHAPLTGIGLQASTQASQVYLQELAAGGLLLFVGVNLYLLGGMIASARQMQHSPLAGMVLAALVTTVGLNFVETDLTDRFYYVPAAILIAMLDVERRQHNAAARLEPVEVPA